MLEQAITVAGISLSPLQRSAQFPTKLEYERKTKGVDIQMNLGMCLPEGINSETRQI
jgi:hypothetical protein